jgi:hypothetical protein
MAYGPFDPYGRRVPTGPPGAPNRNLVPWSIVGGAVLLSGLGLLLVLLLRDGDTTEPASAASTTSKATPASSPTATAHGPLPGGARVVDEDASVGQAWFPGSADAALAWVQAMSDGDFQTAYDLSCPAVQESATAAAAGDGPAGALGRYFFEHTLDGRGFTHGTFDSLIYNSATDSDIGSFTLQLDDGEEFLLLVYVQADGKVCDFV